MKHCILVKWNSLVINKEEILIKVKAVFDKLNGFDGVKNVSYFQNIIDRPNRYDLMICIEMDKSFLEIYDSSQPHLEWKQNFGKFVENKAIFDYEE